MYRLPISFRLFAPLNSLEFQLFKKSGGSHRIGTDSNSFFFIYRVPKFEKSCLKKNAHKILETYCGAPGVSLRKAK